MKSVIKPWNDGGNLTAIYNGSGNGNATFESDSYEGIDRELEVHFIGAGMTIVRKVRQEGIRQPIGLSGGGILRVKGGGRFGVLKEK